MSNKYVCDDGYRLGNWIANQRQNYRKPTKYHSVTPEQVKHLESIGMVWNPAEEKWREGYEHAKEYLSGLDKDKWSSCYVSPDGYRLVNAYGLSECFGGVMCCDIDRAYENTAFQL